MHSVFLDRGSHKICPASRFVDTGKQFDLLVAVVRIDAVVPGDAVVHKVGLVCGRQAWSLLVDAVEASDEGVVAYRHFRCLEGESVCLSVKDMLVRVQPRVMVVAA